MRKTKNYMHNWTFKLKKGDKIVITGGITNGGTGSTNLIKLETL